MGYDLSPISPKNLNVMMVLIWNGHNGWLLLCINFDFDHIKESILLLLSKYDKLYYLLTTFNVVMMCYIRPNYDVTQPKLMSNN